MNTIPYRCVPCGESMVETEDGQVRGYYGVLVKNGVPMTGSNGTSKGLVCPNCGSPLVPSREVI